MIPQISRAGSSAISSQNAHTGRSSPPSRHQNSTAPPRMPSAMKIRSSPSPAMMKKNTDAAAVRQNSTSSVPPQIFPPSPRRAPSRSYSSPRHSPRPMDRKKRISCSET